MLFIDTTNYDFWESLLFGLLKEGEFLKSIGKSFKMHKPFFRCSEFRFTF